MIKQQLRGVIRHFIKKELNEISVSDLEKGKKYKYSTPSFEDEIEFKTEHDSPKGEKMYSFKGNKASHLLDKKHVEDFVHNTTENQPKPAKENKMTKNQLREVIRHLIKKELNEATMWEPEVADPDTEEDVETSPYTLPDEDDDDITIPRPNVKPNPQAGKKLAQKIAARFISLNEKKSK